MDRTRFVLAILLSAIILVGWPLISRKFFPQPEETQMMEPTQLPPLPAASPQPTNTPAGTPGQSNPAQAKTTGKQAQPGQPSQKAQPQITSVDKREFTVDLPDKTFKFSNHGAVATSLILKSERKPDGQVRKLTGADESPLELIPPQAQIDQAGAPFSLRIPGSLDLTKKVNNVNYQVAGIEPSEANITVDGDSKKEVTFTYSEPGLEVTKRYTFYAQLPIFDVSVDVKSNGAVQPADIVIGPRIGDQSDKQTGSYSSPPQVVAASTDGKIERLLGARITPTFTKIKAVDAASKRIEIENPLAGDVDQIRITGKDGVTFVGLARVLDRDSSSHILTLDSFPDGTEIGGKIAQGTDTIRHGYLWAGLVQHYFAMVAVPRGPVGDLVLTNIQLKGDDKSQTPVDFPAVAVPANNGLKIFVGPKDRELLAEVGPILRVDLDPLIDYGMFSFIIHPIVPIIGWALSQAFALTHNYGWGIVLVTIGLNVVLFPLRLHSSKKMKSAAKHQPRLKELQERMKKLKASPKKHEREMELLQKEQMELMKEANPLGGCLPMILQMPILWAIYIYLQMSLDVRHSPWIFWIKDLSISDPYKILPIVMCVTMIGSSMLQPQPAATDPSQKTQRMMMTWLMPIVLTWFFFFSAPSGLVLYWMVSNFAGVVMQFAINKRSSATTPSGPQKKIAEAVQTGKKDEQGRRRKVSEKWSEG